MQTVKVIKVTDGKYFNGEYTSGSTTNVTLQRGADMVMCDGILIWEGDVSDELFDEWVECAVNGEEGYTAMLVKNGKTTMPNKLIFR